MAARRGTRALAGQVCAQGIVGAVLRGAEGSLMAMQELPLRDIHQPPAPPWWPPAPGWWWLAAVVLALLVFAAWGWLRARRRRAAIVRPFDQRRSEERRVGTVGGSQC